MGADRVAVTGAAGRLGRAVVAELRNAGHEVVALDRRTPEGDDPGVPVRPVQLCDVDAVWQALDGCAAVIHLAAFPAPGIVPDTELFANNTQSTFNVLTAAVQAGIGRAVIASSISAYGMAYAAEPSSPAYVPADENHPLIPEDAYALSKQVDEHTAAMFVRSSGISVVAMRFHWIAYREEVVRAVKEVLVEPDKQKRNLWGYVEIGDAARACRLALSVQVGFHPVNICAADTLSTTPTEELVRRYHPDTQIREPVRSTSTAWSIERARKLFGYEPQWSWRSAPD